MAAMTAIAIASLAVGIAGTAMSYSAQKQAGKAQERLSNMNANLDEQAAIAQQRDASVRANAQRQQAQSILAKTRAGYAASGVVGNTGSPLLMESEQAGFLELDALNTQWKGKVNATELRNQAIIARMGGAASASASRMNANATLLSGAGSALDKGASAYNSGMFTAKKSNASNPSV